MGVLQKFRVAATLTVLLTAVSAGGCAGPSTRILPRESREQADEPEELPVLEEANPFYAGRTGNPCRFPTGRRQ